MDNLMDMEGWLRKEIFMEAPYIEEILPSQPGEFIVIAGKPGIGKSTLAMQMAFSLATGIPFLSRFEVEKVQTGYVCMEGSKENIKNRIGKIIPNFPSVGKNLLFNYYQPLNLFRKYEYLTSISNGCKVLTFDNLKQLASGRYLDCSYARDWTERFHDLLCACHAVGILTIHVKKQDGRYLLDPGDLDSVKGSEYTEAATTVLLLERQRQQRKQGSAGFDKVDPSKVNLYFAKTRIATREIEMLPLRLDRNKAMFSVRLD